MISRFHPQSSIILGMHDAIVSLTGLMAGLYFAAVDANLIIISCIIASITAAISMSAANYLAVKATNKKRALLSAFYTGVAYILTCIILITPFLIFPNRTFALTMTLILGILVILGFNLYFYHKRSFFRHFFEMLSICTIVSIIAFLIGEAAYYLFGI